MSTSPTPTSPSLTFPSVHLGSFTSLRLADFPPSPTKASPTSPSLNWGTPRRSTDAGAGGREYLGSPPPQQGDRRGSEQSVATVRPAPGDGELLIRESVRRRTTVVEHPQASPSRDRGTRMLLEEREEDERREMGKRESVMPELISPPPSQPATTAPLTLTPFPTPPLRPTTSTPTLRPALALPNPPVSAPAGLGLGTPPAARRRLPSTPGRGGSGGWAVNGDGMRGVSERVVIEGMEDTPVRAGQGRLPSVGPPTPGNRDSSRQQPQPQPRPPPLGEQTNRPQTTYLRPQGSISSLKPVRQSSYEPSSRPTYTPSFLPGERSGPYPSPTPPLQLRPQPRKEKEEEVCLECMMRDRDLMHVDVMSPGVWRRGSDAGFEGMLEREREVEVGWEWEVAKRRRREEGGGGEGEGRDEGQGLEERLRREVPWRGFGWEEEEGGWGLPRRFRGAREGELLESALRELATKMISPSSHRYKTLQVYLRDQSLLVGERSMSPIEPIPDSLIGHPQPQLSSSIPRPSRDYSDPISHAERVKRAQMAAEAEELEERRRVERELREMEGRRRREREDWEREMAAGGRSRSSSRGLEGGYVVVPPAEMGRVEPMGYQAVDKAHARPQNLDLDARNRRGISSPALLESASPIMNDDAASGRYSLASNSQYPSAREREVDPSQPGQPIRPFSFAVWAGRGGNGSSTDLGGMTSAKSSPGLGARNGGNGVLGRWGGSVTSFFGGSQGGVSGSMMDMHLGLEADARNPPQPNHPRSVSMATPSRSHFFPSRASSFTNDQASIGPSFRSQISSPGPGVEPFPETSGKEKKKGLKGFLRKIGGGGRKKKSVDETEFVAQIVAGGGRKNSPRPDEDFSAPLAPPPPISYLVNRTDRPQPNHIRSPSSNSTSGLIMNNGGLTLSKSQSPTGEWPHPQQQRSVSAPVVKSPSSGSLLSTSPTSSRFQSIRDRDGYQRDSYASASSRRRSSGPGLGYAVAEDGAGEQRWDSGVEVLGPVGHPSSGGGGGSWTEEPGSMLPPHTRASGGTHQKAPSSLSASSGTPYLSSLESPAISLGRQSYAPNSSYSLGLPPSDRQKNLPATPPIQDRSPSGGSPDSFNAFFGPPDRYTYDEALAPPRQTMESARVWEQGHSRQGSREQPSIYSSRADDRERDRERLGGKKKRSRFGLKSFFSIGSGLNKEEVVMEVAAQQQREQGQTRGFDGRFQQHPQQQQQQQRQQGNGNGGDRTGFEREVRGQQGDPRYRQTYYQ